MANLPDGIGLASNNLNRSESNLEALLSDQLEPRGPILGGTNLAAYIAVDHSEFEEVFEFAMPPSRDVLGRKNQMRGKVVEIGLQANERCNYENQFALNFC